MRSAVLYLRSSKDRSDVSIAAQRRELLTLAKSKSLSVIGEFVDAVESGKDEDRAGFQGMLRELKARERLWNVILAFDTSRIARRRYIAQALSHETKKLGVSILYAKVPEVDPITNVILESMLQAMDEVHSLMSREKGLAGMAENVRRGYRAGGRAPTGYVLETVTTDAIREGTPVTKRRLAPGPDGAAIANYLRARATGVSGSVAAKRAGVRLKRSSLVDVEWNALTYAGHTVWQMRRAKDQQGQGSRRPRSEWQIQRNTHQALITDVEAETLLARLEAGTQRRQTRRRGSDYLLSGLLVTPTGKPWHGDAGNYRTRGGFIRSEEVEKAVLAQVGSDFQAPEIIKAYVSEIRKLQQGMANPEEHDAAVRALREVDAKMARLTELLEQTTEPAPLLRRLEDLELARRAAFDRAARAEEAFKQSQNAREVTEESVRAALANLANDLPGLDRDSLKDALGGWIDRVELDPTTRVGRLHYRLTLGGVKLASPRGFEPRLSP